MIKIDGEVVNLGNFPDGTALIKYSPKPHQQMGERAKLSWYYEDDSEFLALAYLVKHLRSHGINDIYLYMPYIPNARQDRVKSSEDVFTLKYFAELLNSLNFTRIEVLDPHSNVSAALINNVFVYTPASYILRVIDALSGSNILVFYPDAGAMSRYSRMIERPYAYGLKNRDWENGKIVDLDIVDNGFSIRHHDILIIDDICSRGGTFLRAAKTLKEHGANDIYLYVSHCENTILEGELLTSGLIKKVFTTDSIFTKEHEKIEVLK